MKRELADIAIYNQVILRTTDKCSYKGWFVPFGKKYAILPLEINSDVYVFGISQIKDITYLRNGYTL